MRAVLSNNLRSYCQCPSSSTWYSLLWSIPRQRYDWCSYVFLEQNVLPDIFDPILCPKMIIWNNHLWLEQSSIPSELSSIRSPQCNHSPRQWTKSLLSLTILVNVSYCWWIRSNWHFEKLFLCSLCGLPHVPNLQFWSLRALIWVPSAGLSSRNSSPYRSSSATHVLPALNQTHKTFRSVHQA